MDVTPVIVPTGDVFELPHGKLKLRLF